MQKSLTLASLGDLDGGAARAIIDAAIREALADLDDRGSDLQPRRVDIRLALKQMRGGLVETTVEVATFVPKRSTAGVIARLSRDACQSHLLFQDGSPDNPYQRTLDEARTQSEKE